VAQENEELEGCIMVVHFACELMLKHIFARRLLISAGVTYIFVYTVLFIVQQPAVFQHDRLIRNTTFTKQATATL
jgi:hypothetical protein